MNTESNPQSVADTERFVVSRTIVISAPVEAVWRAVTEPEHISRWFGRTELDGSGAGALGTMTFDGYGSVPLRVESIDAPGSVTYRWNNDDALGGPPDRFDAERATEFTFTLRGVVGGTELTVVESLFERTSAPAENLDYHREGWNSELDKLVAHLEGRA